MRFANPSTLELAKLFHVTRSTVIVYSQAMLVATLRIQLNIVGGYVYRDSQKSQEEALADENVRQRFLNLFLNSWTKIE